MRNPPWQRDELILALNLYFKLNPTHINSSHQEIKKLSNILNALPIHSDKPDKEKFRNPNGVYMKLCNFLRFDPNYKGKGLERGGKLEEQIWNEFADKPEYLNKIAQNIINSIENIETQNIIIDDDENEFLEGKILYRQHISRERNKTLVKKVKEKAKKQGMLKCQICGFDFYKTYGEIGEGYIECHHTLPISEYSREKGTKIKDLVLVCSNCHRMLHRKRPWLTCDKLKELIVNNRFDDKNY